MWKSSSEEINVYKRIDNEIFKLLGGNKNAEDTKIQNFLSSEERLSNIIKRQ
jgi:hypothetical protein